ncbi:MAG: hypothetical protein LBC37_03235 [Zoogloeaceae bacterium]|nr:hypothetical protein [Zoogloeaceae bacterium]
MMNKLLCLLAIGIVLSACSPEREPARDDPAMLEIKMNRMAREFVLPHLKDADSAEFRNQQGFCGEVNSKNSFGGFTGFQRFIAADKDKVIFERDSGFNAEEFAYMWNELCVKGIAK